MVKNSDIFYEKAKAFQDARNKLEDDYNNRLKMLEPYKGSGGYRQNVDDLNREFRLSLDSLTRNAESELNSIIEGMKKATERYPIKPPTDEQVNTLSLLKMKKAITKADIDAATECVKSNPLALSILTEIANEAGIIRPNHGYKECISKERALKYIDGIEENVRDFLKYNTSRASRVATKHYRIQGINDVDAVRRKPFTNKAGCFHNMAAVSDNALNSFLEIIDYEGE